MQGRSTPRDPRERKRKKRHFTRAHRPAGVIASAPFEPDALRRPGFEPVRGRAALLALALLQGTFPGSDDIPADQLARRFAHIREACEELLGVLELPRHP